MRKPFSGGCCDGLAALVVLAGALGGCGPAEPAGVRAAASAVAYRVQLQTVVASDYLTAEGGGGGDVRANRAVASSWETFLLHRVGGGAIHDGDQVQLQTSVKRLYVSALGGGGGGVVADRAVAGSWETFRIAIVSGGPGDGGSDVLGKISVGYHGWFSASNDGSGIQPPWWHVTNDRQTPTAHDIAFESWPDMSDLATRYVLPGARRGRDGVLIRQLPALDRRRRSDAAQGHPVHLDASDGAAMGAHGLRRRAAR